MISNRDNRRSKKKKCKIKLERASVYCVIMRVCIDVHATINNNNKKKQFMYEHIYMCTIHECVFIAHFSF